jgi:hypothetical protein
MRWGLSREPTGLLDQSASEGPVHHLYLYVASELPSRVEQAAANAGMNMAPWLRRMVRQRTMADVPASWQGARSEQRSHDSRPSTERFMLRRDEPSSDTRQSRIERFAVWKATRIRQLLAQTTPEDVPKCWHMRAAEHRAHNPAQDDRHIGRIT